MGNFKSLCLEVDESRFGAILDRDVEVMLMKYGYVRGFYFSTAGL